MADMTPYVFDAQHHAQPRRSLGDALIFYSVFAVLFAAYFVVFAAMRVFGKRRPGGVFKAAKRSANGPAGYAVRF
ncbi:MAG: hypothetical protein AAF862_13250 [Pseudomonadota bacterium]